MNKLVEFISLKFDLLSLKIEISWARGPAWLGRRPHITETGGDPRFESGRAHQINSARSWYPKKVY